MAVETQPETPDVVSDAEPDVVAPAAETEPEPDPDDDEGEPDVVLPGAALPDPEHLTGERECPLCDGVGRLPFGVKVSTRYKRCDECGGIGTVYTGSLVSESAVVQCEPCRGAGYVGRLDTVTVPPAPLVAVPLATEPPWPGAVFDQAAGSWR